MGGPIDTLSTGLEAWPLSGCWSEMCTKGNAARSPWPRCPSPFRI